MPRVGSSSTTTRTDSDSQRARMAFCWLPPESKPMGVAAEAVRTPRRAICAAALVRSQPPCRKKLACSRERRALRLMFSATERTAMMPSFLRSSGQNTRPARMAVRGEPPATTAPCTRTSPPVGGTAPHSSRMSSVRPAPTSPKNPTISPRATSNDTGVRNPGPARLRTASPSGPCGRGR